VNEQADGALDDALAFELRAAQSRARVSAPKIEELTGITRDTVRRILKGVRSVTVAELAKLAVALDFDDSDLVSRAKNRAAAALRSTASNGQSRRLNEKLTLAVTSLGRSPESMYQDLVPQLTARGFHFPRSAWQELLVSTSVTAHREVLSAISASLEIDPRYLTDDVPAVDHSVEASLRFHRAMRDLGVDHVSTRALDELDPSDLLDVQHSIEEALRRRDERQGRSD
jgi:transcriptional regulator with XRE-family HTH domain